MAHRHNVIVLTVVALFCLVGMTVALSDVPRPDIPRGQGESCVANTDFMRRNHMTMLEHQRDDTMLKGVRGDPYSLKDCVSCHAVDGADGTPVTVSSPEHFCRLCHDYAAVNIDCFQCHASRPDATPVDESE
jgi:predicted CXXCH cytochrome family protein